VWAIKSQLSQYSQRGVLEYYLDLHAHANKKGVFVYGNMLEGERAVEGLLYSRLVALNSPIFDFIGCNFTEKNMSRPDKVCVCACFVYVCSQNACLVSMAKKGATLPISNNQSAEINYTYPFASFQDGASKEGAGRVALFRETGLTHLYTVEANYNTARVLNLVPPASGRHGGRASPSNSRRISPRFTADVLQAGGHAFLVCVCVCVCVRIY